MPVTARNRNQIMNMNAPKPGSPLRISITISPIPTLSSSGEVLAKPVDEVWPVVAHRLVDDHINDHDHERYIGDHDRDVPAHEEAEIDGQRGHVERDQGCCQGAEDHDRSHDLDRDPSADQILFESHILLLVDFHQVVAVERVSVALQARCDQSDHAVGKVTDQSLSNTDEDDQSDQHPVQDTEDCLDSSHFFLSSSHQRLRSKSETLVEGGQGD